MKNYKIALFMIAPPTQGGGAEKYFVNLSRNLSSRKDIETDLVTFNNESFRKFARLLHIFTRGNLFWKIDDYERGMREKREDIQKGLGGARWIESPRKKIGNVLRDYDAVYAKNEIADLFFLRMIGRKKLPPVIVGVHTPLFYPRAELFFSKFHNFLYSSFFYKWLLRGAVFVHVSNASAKDIVENKLRVKSRLIYYPFSVGQIRNSAQSNKSEIEFDAIKTNLIFVGRLTEQKGIDVLIRMIERIGEDESEAKKISVNVFGSGDKKHEDAINRLTEKYSFVRYFGHVENKFIPDVLGSQDIMVAPSKWETMPYSILEAQAMGVPVVAFDIPGPSDIIRDKKTGYLAKNEDEFIRAALSMTKKEISFDKGEIVRNIENKFSPEKIYFEMKNMFLNLPKD